MRATARSARNRRVRSGDGGTVVQGRRRAVQAGHDLGRAGRHGLHWRRDDGQIGRQSADAHHRAAWTHCSVAAMAMLSGCILLGRLMMGVRFRVVVRRAVMIVASLHLVVHRHRIGEAYVVKTGGSAIAPGKTCCWREHAEQIGEGDDPPHPDPQRSRQSQQHSADMLSARQECTRRLQTSSKSHRRQAPCYRSAPRMPNIAPQCLTL